MVRSLDENPEKGEGFHVQIGEKKKPKGKHAHTQSQIFKYAYGQIEKEKAMEQDVKNLTFSGVISMATEEDIKKRPTIEIAFKDLTLTLKGSKKKLFEICDRKAHGWSGSGGDGPIRRGEDHILECYCWQGNRMPDNRYDTYKWENRTYPLLQANHRLRPAR